MAIEFRTFDAIGKPDADVSTVVVQVGLRGQLDTEHAAEAARGILKARETYPAAQIVRTVAGYEADNRELWDLSLKSSTTCWSYSTWFSPNGATARLAT
jgi:hypothetical protein